MPPSNVSVDDVVAAWIRHFWAADRALTWTHSERERAVSLATGLTLCGRIDADGKQDAGNTFFGEWKTSNPRNRNGWKEKWRLHPQSLTYGLLMRELDPTMRRFTIRMAFKSNPPTFDHEWFEYSDGELDMWRDEVIRIAGEIAVLHMTNLEHWPLNPLSCYKWGPSYPCERLANCSKQRWSSPGANVVARVPHLDIEQQASANGPLLLDATRITAYLECPEAYRAQYVRNEVEPPGEALSFGTQFHALLAAYYEKLAAGEKFEEVSTQWPNQ
jgi:PD-(D/E)XK nuclease superfamily